MKINGLSFSYGDRKIFKDLNLEIPDDKITAICGASGCGKTTLLKLIAGILLPDKGEIQGPKKSDIAFLFQEDRLLPMLNAAGQIDVVIEKNEKEALNEKYTPAYWLEMVELKGEANTPIAELSGGMKRRVALARCLAFGFDKKLLILDEPFEGVDQVCAERIMRRIKDMNIQVLFTAHNEQVVSLADTKIDI